MANAECSVEVQEPQFGYVVTVAGYVADLGNRYLIASTYEYINGSMIVIVDCTGEKPVEIVRQQSSDVESGRGEVWKLYQEMQARGEVPAANFE